MRWLAYLTYRHSSEDWLGDVPSEWNQQRLKRCVRLVDDRAIGNTDGLPYVGLEHIQSWTGKLMGTDDEHGSDAMVQRFQSGDVLFNKLRPYLAKVVRATHDGVCTGELLVLRPTVVLAEYLKYYLLSRDFIWAVDSSTYGAKMPRANWDYIGGLSVLVPEISTQRAIASFLDRETARIDSLIEKKQRQIELLQEKRAALISHAVTKGLDPNAKMKDSWIEWLGEVPQHWEIAPLYSRYTVELGKMLDSKRIVGTHLLPYLRNVDTQWDYVRVADLPEMDIEERELQRYTLQNGDLLVCEGGEVGRTAIWRGELPLCGYQKALHRLRPRGRDDEPRFFYYVMREAARTGVFLARGNPNTIPHLTGEQLRVYRFPFPPAPEQHAIVQHLDSTLGMIDALGHKVEESITALREYRSALITAAVTGKIDVREEVA